MQGKFNVIVGESIELMNCAIYIILKLKHSTHTLDFTSGFGRRVSTKVGVCISLFFNRTEQNLSLFRY